MEFSRYQVRLHGVPSEIPGSSFQKHVIESQWAKIVTRVGVVSGKAMS